MPKRSQEMKTVLAGFLLMTCVRLVAAGSPPILAEQLLGHYYIIQKSLASDSIEGVSASAAKMADISRRAAATEPHAKAQLTALANAAAKLRATDLKSARNGFGELSDGLLAYLQATQAKRNPPYQFYCSMVKKNWLQPAKETRNPYYGSSMLKCGELIQSGQSVGQHMGPNHH
jgi:hypothetical protein